MIDWGETGFWALIVGGLVGGFLLKSLFYFVVVKTVVDFLDGDK